MAPKPTKRRESNVNVNVIEHQSYKDMVMREKKLHQKSTLISTDGIPRSASDGKKTEQRQRKRTATTQTHTSNRKRHRPVIVCH